VPGVGIDTFPGLSIFRERGDPTHRPPTPDSVPPSALPYSSPAVFIFPLVSRHLSHRERSRRDSGAFQRGVPGLSIDRSVGFTSYPREAVVWSRVSADPLSQSRESRIRQARCHFFNVSPGIPLFIGHHRASPAFYQKFSSVDNAGAAMPTRCYIDTSARLRRGSLKFFIYAHPASLALISRRVAYLEGRMRNGKSVPPFLSAVSYSPAGREGLLSSLYFNPLIKTAMLPISRLLSCTLRLIRPNKRLRAFSPPVPSLLSPREGGTPLVIWAERQASESRPRPKSAGDS